MKPSRYRCHPFTLAESLAALVVIAVVIPVASRSVLVATRASQAAIRTGKAARIASRQLNALMLDEAWTTSPETGEIEEWRDARWELRTENWSQEDAETVPMTLVTVVVVFPLEGKELSVEVSTLAAASTKP